MISCVYHLPLLQCLLFLKDFLSAFQQNLQGYFFTPPKFLEAGIFLLLMIQLIPTFSDVEVWNLNWWVIYSESTSSLFVSFPNFLSNSFLTAAHPFRLIVLSCLLTVEGWTETPVLFTWWSSGGLPGLAWLLGVPIS